MSNDVLVVDDDPGILTTCMALLRREGYAAHSCGSVSGALEWLASHGDDAIVVSDIRMPGKDGMELLAAISAKHPRAQVILMTGFGSIPDAVAAMRQGAVDYIAKPFNKDELLMAVARAAHVRELENRVASLTQGIESRYRFEGMVAGSASMKDVLEAIRAACGSSAAVLLTGESGTGKDLVARTIHFAGGRASGPFVPVNCASLPGDLIESELFGHARGAYTGADRDRRGLIRQAEGGTLLLDEITEMPLGAQAKLLRVLQERHVRPVGAQDEIPVNFRLIAATNRPIHEALESGQLREDVYYRIAVLQIELPPLRDRREDVVPLFRMFLDRFSGEGRAEPPRLTPGAAAILEAAPWPGNVRELANLAERCVALRVAGELTAEALRPLLMARTAAGSGRDGCGSLKEAERDALESAMERADGNKSEAARILGIARKTLYEKLREHEIS